MTYREIILNCNSSKKKKSVHYGSITGLLCGDYTCMLLENSMVRLIRNVYH